jgi:GWxTD domain-containing protein
MRSRILAFLCIVSAILTAKVFSQPTERMGMRHRNGPFGGSMFFFQLYNFADTTDLSRSQVDFHVSFVNDILTFFKEKDSYSAKYELGVIFYNEKNVPIRDKSVTNTIHVNTFRETNLRTHPIHHKFSISLPPGEYKYELYLIDNDEQKIVEREGKTVLRDFGRDKLHLSDVIFAEDVNCSAWSDSVNPNLRDTFIDQQKQVAALYEIYPANSSLSDQLDVTYKVFTERGENVYSDEKSVRAVRFPLKECIIMNDLVNEPGNYYLIVEVSGNGQTAKIKRSFTIQWRNLNVQEENVDVAIEQLSLIAKGREIDDIKKAEGEERDKLFEEFWERRDPTPDTPRNELREEFFRRIDFSNHNFAEPAHHREGWRTDRGRIYIQNGPPDQIEKQPVAPGMPQAEIWYYSKLDKRYIFSDRLGNGEYRLVRVE